MSETTETDEEIALIDRLRPALIGKNTRERLALFFCISIFGFFSVGCTIGYSIGTDFVSVENIIYRAVMLGLILIVCSAITLLSTLIFIKTFQQSLDSKEELPKTERATQPKAAQS